MREMTAGMTSVCDAWLALCGRAVDTRRHGVCCLSWQRHMRLTLTTTSVSLILVAIFKQEKSRWVLSFRRGQIFDLLDAARSRRYGDHGSKGLAP